MEKKRKATDADETNGLRKIVANFNGGEDEFGDQPGSGSAIGGTRGEQEYGIKGGISSEEKHGVQLAQPSVDASGGVSGFSARGLSASSEEDAVAAGEGEVPDHSRSALRDLRSLLPARLKQHPLLKNSNIKVQITWNGGVTLQGIVHSEAEKIAARELAEAVATGMAVDNRLTVDRAA